MDEYIALGNVLNVDGCLRTMNPVEHRNLLLISSYLIAFMSCYNNLQV